MATTSTVRRQTNLYCWQTSSMTTMSPKMTTSLQTRQTTMTSPIPPPTITTRLTTQCMTMEIHLI